MFASGVWVGIFSFYKHTWLGNNNSKFLFPLPSTRNLHAFLQQVGWFELNSFSVWMCTCERVFPKFSLLISIARVVHDETFIANSLNILTNSLIIRARKFEKLSESFASFSSSLHIIFIFTNSERKIITQLKQKSRIRFFQKCMRSFSFSLTHTFRFFAQS